MQETVGTFIFKLRSSSNVSISDSLCAYEDIVDKSSRRSSISEGQAWKSKSGARPRQRTFKLCQVFTDTLVLTSP